ncbi:MAG: tRNA (adenosine(37)-N6)-dimethylallyltransferase MiaA [Chloroflexi bacterium]|nr:tRNA (adenosine(37)-N6)-dimethylallyltransferase MiaA [Chloroflexota bacterium]
MNRKRSHALPSSLHAPHSTPHAPHSTPHAPHSTPHASHPTPHAPRLLVIVGPTAVGKTAIAIDLAERINGEIISADSRTLYRGMDIGTAKPTLAERARVAHHLIDVADPDQSWSLAQYRDAAAALIVEINARDRLPMLVGGAGQYIHAILEGWSIPKRAADPQARAELEAIAARDGADELYRRLREIDPLAAASIDSRNVRRVIRALEVTLSTGQPFSAQRQKTPPRYRSLIIGLSLARPKLYRRIDERIDAMFANGLVAEGQTLAAKGYDWSLPALSAIGYKQVGMYLRGECDLAEAVQRIKRETRRFVRRQANWFKPDDPNIRWHNVESLNAERLADEVLSFFAHS